MDKTVLEEKVKEHSSVLSPYIGLEDVRGYGERLAEYLHERYPVVHVPSVIVDRLRQNATHPEKSDSLDVKGVAKAMVLNTGRLLPYTISAPRERSSGKKIRHVKSRSGNRRLNCAFHRMALSQISKSGNELAKKYFKRKVSEGKSKSQALVCLRRQMVNIVWMMLKHKTVYNPQPN